MAKTASKITIHEVAARAGVSAMTVSRVLRNAAHVAPDTREAVRLAMRELNYEPLQSARNLASAYAKVIGLVVPHAPDDIDLRSGYEYLSALHLGAIQACRAHDYGLMLVNMDGGGSAVETLVRRARSRQIGGYVVAAPATEFPGLIEALREHGIAHSSISPRSARVDDSWVAAAERDAMCRLTIHMLDKGHREVAFVGGDWETRACSERHAGFLAGLEQYGIALRKSRIQRTGYTFEAGLLAGQRLLAHKVPPSAVCCETDDVAAGVMAAARMRGLRLPDDLSVVGFDDFGLARKLWPGLTTAHLPVEEMSAHAVSQVVAVLEDRVQPNQVMPCVLRIRESVRVVQASPAG